MILHKYVIHDDDVRHVNTNTNLLHYILSYNYFNLYELRRNSECKNKRQT